MNAKQQYDKFLDHLKLIHSSFQSSRSSLKPLFEILDIQLKRKKIALLDGKVIAAKLGKDRRIAKYKNAIDMLLSVWGTTGDYVVPKSVHVPKESMLSPVADGDAEWGSGRR